MSTWMRDVERRLAAVERPSRLSTVQYTNVTAPNVYQIPTASWSTMWEFNLSLVVADAVSVAAAVITQAGVTLDLRVIANTSGVPTTDVLSFPAATEDVVRFDWLVPNLIIGATGTYIQLQARRTAGADGGGAVFTPNVAMQVPSYEVDADATGNPRIV